MNTKITELINRLDPNMVQCGFSNEYRNRRKCKVLFNINYAVTKQCKECLKLIKKI